MRALPFLLSLLFPVAATAQSAPVNLWKELVAGDDAETVAGKLAADPEIKSAKVRGGNAEGEPQVVVRYRSAGIDVFGMKFAVSPEFYNGKLRRVFLTTAPMCANDAPEQFSQISAVLHEKYPESPVQFAESEDDQVRSARMRGTDEHPATAGRIFRGGGVTVTYQQTFTEEQEPPTGYVDSAAVAAVGRLLMNQYLSRQRECDGTGNHRMTHAIIYMADEDFNDMDAKIHRDAKGVSEKAKSNL